MGEVYLAQLEREAGFSKIVAVKRILPHLSDDPAFVSMFNREACIAAQLNHRNVVDIYDYGQHDGAYFIAMEYVGGTDLRSLLDAAATQAAPLPVATAASIVSEACAGLDYAHRRKDALDGTPLGIVHRDVSPQNILVSSEGEVKLTDFGLATRAEEDANDDGQIQGKFSYMSPEQTFGDELTPRSDIFSLGIVAYELLCGRRPFEADSVGDLLSLIRSGRYRTPTDVRPELPPAVDGILAKALAVEPRDRWEDARAFGAAIDELAREQGWATGALAVAATVTALCPDEQRPAADPSSGTQVASKPIVPERTLPAAAAMTELARADTDPGPDSHDEEITPPAQAAKPVRRAAWPLLLGIGVVIAVVAVVAWFATRPPEAREWTLEVTPTPAEAQVYVDGDRVGVGRTAVRRPAGEFLVEVRAPGFKSHQERVRLDERGGVYPIRPVLASEVATGRLVLTVGPVDADVTVAGAVVEAADPAAGLYEFDRPGGVVAVTATRQGYLPWKQNVLVRNGSTVSVPIRLAPRPVKVIVRGDRKGEGRVVIEADEFKSECGLPCTQQVPYAKNIRVEVAVDGAKAPWVHSIAAAPGKTVTFIAPVPVPVREPVARVRAVLSGKDKEGKGARKGLVDANVLKRPKGSRRARIDGVVTVSFRYEYDDAKGLRVTLATDPYSTVTLNGKGVGTTPVVGRSIPPGNHRFHLKEHGATVSVRFDR